MSELRLSECVGTSESAIDPVSREIIDQLTALRQELAAIRQRLTAIEKQQGAIQALFMQFPQASSHPKQVLEPGNSAALPTERIIGSCAQDIVRVLEEVGHPLTTPEILEEVVHRHLSWRENTVLHALDELLDRGAISDTGDIRPHTYGPKRTI